MKNQTLSDFGTFAVLLIIVVLIVLLSRFKSDRDNNGPFSDTDFPFWW